ncbi:hypothetical protein EAO70_37245, partial [Streptomyces sp. adm13(2018)]|uniref:hypothetical protein n=1 Tax=Streptomyces sp. adm13(2018) TaxID=2479007 RepID=UPI0011CD68A5
MAEQTPENTEPNEPVAFDITNATDEQLIAEYGRVRTAGAELSAKADADPNELSGLASQLQELSAAVAERKTRAEATQAARDAFVRVTTSCRATATDPAGQATKLNVVGRAVMYGAVASPPGNDADSAPPVMRPSCQPRTNWIRTPRT